MEILEGKYTKAKIYTVGELEPYARAQLQMLCDNECLAGSRVRVMPDVHPGKVGTIGLTMTVSERLMPFLTGIDIGCGVTMARVRKGKREWDRLDSVIKSSIPAGFASRQKPHAKAAEFDFSRLYCAKHIRQQRAALALGTLGSGNHFIEVGTDGEKLYLFIHSGSGRGYLPAGLVEEIRSLTTPPIPWEVELAQWFDSQFPPLEKHRS